MRILGMIIVMMSLGLSASFAATVDLNDGRVVQGDIIKQDNKSVQISVDGVTVTYYADEVKDVDGKPLVAPQTQPAVAPAAGPVGGDQPEAAAVAPVSTAAPVLAAGTMDEDKRALILKFIDVFGTRQALINNFDSMLKQIAKEKPDEAQKIRERIKVDEIIERLLPIYDRNFSAQDLKAFITFYSSPEGQKLITTIPELMKESVKESVKYMEEKFPEAQGG